VFFCCHFAAQRRNPPSLLVAIQAKTEQQKN
jgi:hypothetical protein